MKEIKLTIDGEEVQLTEGQLKMLGIKPEKKRKNPFDIEDEKPAYYINQYGEVECTWMYLGRNVLAKACNAFNDKPFANQVALHQLLYRKLLRFAYDNGYEDTAEWNGENAHWSIYYDYENHALITDWSRLFKLHGVWFSSQEGAERAIKEVAEPFMEEHPDFAW